MMLLRFNERLKELRELKKISQTELAEMLGLSRSAVSSWEQGISEPTANHIVELAYIFNCSTDYLLSVDNKELIDVSYVINDDKAIVHSLIDRFKSEYDEENKT